MNHDPSPYEGVPVDATAAHPLDVPLALRISDSIQDVLRGEYVGNTGRKDLEIYASRLREAALGAARRRDEEEGGRSPDEVSYERWSG